LRERLEIIVAIYLRVVVYRNLTKDLKEDSARSSVCICVCQSIDFTHLHAYYSVNEKEHYDEKGDIG
jgi:hypothetical protein